MKDAKYLLGYIPPLAGFLAIYFAGIWSYLGFMIAFMIVPAVEFLTTGTTENMTEEEEDSALKNRFFDIMLYMNLPIYFGLLYYFGWRLSAGGLEMYEIVGLTTSVGILCASIGINVAHELGHRKTRYEQIMSRMLLMTSLYMHFFIEHNRGHHKNVATDEDPASSKYGETLYAFFLRSIPGCYVSAWRLEAQRLKRRNLPALHWRNEMIWYQLIQVLYLATIALVFSWQVMLCFVVAATIGFLLLETINYVEHYGLRRKKLASGRYEHVGPNHSWNSNHNAGRILLYELTRHSDHHFKATRKYQTLRHFDESPQLPYGYPASILIAFFPPLWFKMMNKEVERYNSQQQDLVIAA